MLDWHKSRYYFSRSLCGGDAIRSHRLYWANIFCDRIRASFPIAQNLLDDVNLESINLPVYLVAHKNDLCDVTPPSDIKVLESRLRVSSPKVKKKIFNGGTTTLTDECNLLPRMVFLALNQKW